MLLVKEKYLGNSSNVWGSSPQLFRRFYAEVVAVLSIHLIIEVNQLEESFYGTVYMELETGSITKQHRAV